MNNELNLTEQEANNILIGAEYIMTTRRSEQINFNLELPAVVALIGQLQLGFRHPENTGPTRRMVEAMIRNLINTVAPARDELHQLLMMGFESEFDSPTAGTRSLDCRHCKHSLPLAHAILNGYCPNCREHICPACGCTDSAGCAEICFWLPSGICSTCAKDLN